MRSCRLVTLAGVGGVGKTRLALEVASVLAEEFPDGAFTAANAPHRPLDPADFKT